MTNGELIQKFFDCEVCEPIPEDDIIHVIFPDKNDSAIGFDWSWWNMEYKKPTTKNDLGVDCISRVDAIRVASGYCHPSNIAKELAKLPSVTPQEPMVIPIAEVKFDEDKLKELVDKAVFTAVTPQDPFINKPCVSDGACEHDKQKVLKKIRDEIEAIKLEDSPNFCVKAHNDAVDSILEIIDKYKAESEENISKMGIVEEEENKEIEEYKEVTLEELLALKDKASWSGDTEDDEYQIYHVLPDCQLPIT